MAYTPIQTTSEYLSRLSQLYIDAAVSDTSPAFLMNDLSVPLRNAIRQYVRENYFGGGMITDDEIEGIRTAWDDNCYSDIISVIKSYVNTSAW